MILHVPDSMLGQVVMVVRSGIESPATTLDPDVIAFLEEWLAEVDIADDSTPCALCGLPHRGRMGHALVSYPFGHPFGVA